MSDAPANRMARPHRHDDIELTVLESGWIDYLSYGVVLRSDDGGKTWDNPVMMAVCEGYLGVSHDVFP